MQFEGHYIETARGRFFVRQGGEGPPLVMLHGWPQSSYCWEPMFERLGDEYRIIAPDLRGLGDSERTRGVDNYRKYNLARDVVAVLDTLGVKAFNLVGHDWGGVVAQEIAMAVPDRVQRLVITNIPVIANKRGYAKAREKLFPWRLHWLSYQFFQMAPKLPEWILPGQERRWLSLFLRFTQGRKFPDEAFEEYVRCYAIPGTAETGANYYRAMRDDAKRWKSVAGTRFSMPALYIYGRRDPVVIPEFTHHLDDVFDDIRVETLPAGHFVAEELPDEFAALVRDFLG